MSAAALALLNANRSRRPSLRAALERVMDATPEELSALRADLAHEHADETYAIRHARARLAVLELLAELLEAAAGAPA